MSTPEPSGAVVETTLADRAQGADRKSGARRRTAAWSSTTTAARRIRFSRENVERLLAGGSFFWIDVDQPGEDDYKILREVFKFHPLAVEDLEHFNQRAKLDDYDDYVFIVVYGASDADRLVEVHCFVSGTPSITVPRRDRASPKVRQRP